MLAMSRRVVLMTCLAVLSVSQAAQAGVVVYGTRFILTPDAPVAGITVENSGTQTYLLNSQIERDDAKSVTGSISERPMLLPAPKGALPLLVTPPLTLLQGGHSNQLRLVCSECETFPSDRESLYRLSIAAIPAGKMPSNAVQIALRSRFKVFYRPSGLSAVKARSAYTQLTWSRNRRQVTVHNPTPYYVTLFRLQVNGRELADAGMVPPFSARTQPWCSGSDASGKGNCVIQWSTLDDNSGERPVWQVSPDSSVVQPGYALNGVLSH